jgi:tetraacyldisaccharide 4'-kinase
LLVVSDPRSVLADGAQAGDEALLLARRLPGVPVVAGADRALAGRRALEDFSPDVLVMDDGFQHFRLHRDMDLACLDASQDGALFRRGALLPAGRLREPLSGLARAGVVFLTKSDLASPEDLAFLKERAAELAPEATVVPVRYRVSLWDLGNPVKDAKGLPVLALSALARPEAFESSLRRLGAEVAAQRFRDHHVFTPWEREAALERARREGRRLVVTEKDRQRLPADFPCLVARLDWEPEDVRTKTGEPWTSRIDSLIA